MVDPGHLFRRALSWLPANFVSLDHSALDAPPQFSSTDHLSAEAVAAYVDGELLMKAHLRAAGHLSRCPQCAAEVEAQSQARDALRDSRSPNLPSSLMGLLSARGAPAVRPGGSRAAPGGGPPADPGATGAARPPWPAQAPVG